MSDEAKIALVNMPFSYAKYPSIQLGTLSALLKSNGIPVDCHHLNVRFAHLIGVELHESICEKRALFGEWLFSYLLFCDNPKRVQYPQIFKPVFEQVAQESGKPARYFEEMATRIAPQFLTWALTAINWGQYKLVGFTSSEKVFPRHGYPVWCGGAPSGTVCSGSACVATCSTGLTECSGVCRDLSNDRLNCGTCGNTCATGASCVAGTCTCPGTQIVCGGSCVDVSTDLDHCGHARLDDETAALAVCELAALGPDRGRDAVGAALHDRRVTSGGDPLAWTSAFCALLRLFMDC